MKDYYKILGVTRNASSDDIKRAFRKLAHQFHPDKAGGNEKKFKEINEAYQILSDSKRRAQYDQFGTTFEGRPSGFSGFEGFGFDPFKSGAFSFSDFEEGFGDLFSEFFGVPRTRTAKRRRGQDVVTSVEISLEQAFFGAQKILHIKTDIACGVCRGSGGEPGASMRRCKTCGGRGRVEETSRHILGTFTRLKTCFECDGRGEAPERPCLTCQGKGYASGIKDLEIRIPQGIEDGQVLMVRGEGAAGSRGIESGNLAVTIHVSPHPVFRRSGTTLLSRRDIPFSIAVLGGIISVDTIDGKSVRLKVPQGIPSGKVFRLRGRGMPSFGAGSRGDHLVTVRVHVPEKISSSTRRLLQDLQNEGL